ncbi:MAG: tripartite tricarboxylate transporter substrate binding protein [Steroidobacteraceae bacterium]
MRRRSILTLAASGLVPLAGLSQAQSVADRPLKVVVAWPGGGFIDVTTRAMTEKFTALSGRTVVIENKPGAYGLIGTEYVIQSRADGNTWLIGTMGTPMSNSLYKRKWVAADELAGVAMMGRSALVAVVPSSLPPVNMREFIALARSQPGKLNYLNPGIGSATHLNTELIKLQESVKITSVMYNGQPPGIVDLIAGQVHFGLLAPQLVRQHVLTGKLKALAVAYPSRLKDYPDVPTIAEAGYPDAAVVATYTVLVPKKTPKDVIARMNVDILKALQDPEVRRRFEAAGAFAADPSTPEQVDAFMRAETQRWERFFREVKIDIAS